MAPGVIEGPGDPVATPPARRPGSVRRTSSVLMSWPDGLTEDLLLEGGPATCSRRPMAIPRCSATPTWWPHRPHARHQAHRGGPEPAGLQQLVGCAAGGNLRKAIAQTLPEEVEAGTPLYLLLDDLAGASLISGFAFFKWADAGSRDQERVAAAPRQGHAEHLLGLPRWVDRAGCPTARSSPSATTRPIHHSLVDPADPLGWHELHPHPDIAMRRARRIDVWWKDGTLADRRHVPRQRLGSRRASSACCTSTRCWAGPTVTGTLRSITAVPRVLPYAECPWRRAQRVLAGGDAAACPARRGARSDSRTTDCCTHLNDALRSLAEVPLLAASFPS